MLYYCALSFIGVRIGLFTPDRAFEHVCRQQIGRLKEPALKLSDLVVQEVTSLIRDILVKVNVGRSSSVFSRYSSSGVS